MINLSQNYRVNKDAHNLVLEELKIVPEFDKKGNKNKNPGENWIVLGYYSCMEHIFKALLDRKIKDVVGDFSKLEAVYSELKEMIKEVR